MSRSFIITAGVVLFICLPVEAQYRTNKDIYDYREYVYQPGDRYLPGLAGFCSFPVPGLGQIISGEPLRGLAFLGGTLGCGMLYFVGGVASIGGIESGEKDPVEFLAIIGGLGLIAIDIWAIIDASRVAKVNNLAIRDQNKESFNLQVQPYIYPYEYSNFGRYNAGISMNIRF